MRREKLCFERGNAGEWFGEPKSGKPGGVVKRDTGVPVLLFLQLYKAPVLVLLAAAALRR